MLEEAGDGRRGWPGPGLSFYDYCLVNIYSNIYEDGRVYDCVGVRSKCRAGRPAWDDWRTSVATEVVAEKLFRERKENNETVWGKITVLLLLFSECNPRWVRCVCLASLGRNEAKRLICITKGHNQWGCAWYIYGFIYRIAVFFKVFHSDGQVLFSILTFLMLIHIGFFLLFFCQKKNTFFQLKKKKIIIIF